MNIKNLDFKFSKKILTITNEQEEKNVKFELKVQQVEKFDNVFVIRLDVPKGVVFNENVFGVSHDGRILWQIEKLKYVYKDSPFTGMGRQGGNIKLCNWDGTDLLVNPETGEIISKEWSK